MNAVKTIAQEINAMPLGVKVIAGLSIVGTLMITFQPPKPATVEPTSTKTEVVQSAVTPDHYINEANRKMKTWKRDVDDLNLQMMEHIEKHEYRKARDVADQVILETELLIEDPDIAIAVTQDQDINDRIYGLKQGLFELKLNRAKLSN